APLVPLTGIEAADAVRDGLIAHWRQWSPIRKSERAPDERHRVRSLDVMGIAGVALEATVPGWADRLTPELAERATIYAMLEINGFPRWMADLSACWPQEVARVLISEIVSELDDPSRAPDVLQDVARSDDGTSTLMAPALLEELERRPQMRALALSPM